MITRPADIGFIKEDSMFELPSLNYSEINVNNSQYFQDYTPTTLKDWIQGLFDSIYCKLTGCEMKGNITSNSWFNGLFNWTTDDWHSFNGYNLTFNESKLSTTYYNVMQYQIVNGNFDGGTLEDTQHLDGAYDGVTLNISEVSGSPGLDIRFNFTEFDGGFNAGIIRYKTSSLSGDYPVIQMWNYNSGSWDDFPPIAEVSENFVTIVQPVFDDSRHIQDGVAQMRIYKSSNGNTNNHYYVDWIAVSEGYGIPSGQEVDPYSWHRNGVIEVGNFTTTGNVTANWFYGQWNGSSNYVQKAGDSMTGNLNMTNNNITDINYLKLTNTTTTWNMYVDVNGTLVWEQE